LVVLGQGYQTLDQLFQIRQITRQFQKEGLNFEDQISLVKHSRGLLTRFGTMDTMPTGLKEKEQGATMSQPTQPEDPGQKSHYRGDLEDN
jgi:hypothetical protein